jgi:hypothetical protein
MGDGDEDKWIALIKGIEGVLGNHVDNEEDQVNATENGHDAKASERRC